MFAPAQELSNQGLSGQLSAGHNWSQFGGAREGKGTSEVGSIAMKALPPSEKKGEGSDILGTEKVPVSGAARSGSAEAGVGE